MPGASRNLCLSTRRRDSLATRDIEHHLRVRFLVLFFLFCLLGARALASTGTGVPSVPAPSRGPGPSFAIADFDGDQRPDFASVDGGQVGAASTYNYWIEFKLTAGGREAIHVLAPFGGLAIEARDVNGDHAVDLIVTTAWLRQPVAVFLNDGHGRFSRAEPAQFPGAFSDSPTNWSSSSNRGSAAVGIPTQSRLGACPDERSVPNVRGPTGSLPALSTGFPPDSLLTASAGRAPPSEVTSL